MLSSADLVVTSVLENFVTEVCTGIPDDKVQLFAHQLITAHVESLSSLLTRLPDVNIIINPPLYRSVPAWYGSYIPDMLGFLTAEVNCLGSRRIGLCSPFMVVPSMFEADGVDLIQSAGDHLLAHLDSEVSAMLHEVHPTEDISGPLSMDLGE